MTHRARSEPAFCRDQIRTPRKEVGREPCRNTNCEGGQVSCHLNTSRRVAAEDDFDLSFRTLKQQFPEVVLISGCGKVGACQAHIQ